MTEVCVCVYVGVSSASSPSGSRLTECSALAKSVVDAAQIHRIEEVNTRPFWTISYYYDRAVDTKLIGTLIPGPIVSILATLRCVGGVEIASYCLS